jgi:hypothetical protein
MTPTLFPSVFTIEIGAIPTVTFEASDRARKVCPYSADLCGLALQLCFLWTSESMGNHDSNVVGAGRVC